VLLAWNDLGMHCISDSDPWFVILPPGNTLEALLIKRGETPELVSKGVEITYAVEKGYRDPAAHVDFWKYAESHFGKKITKPMQPWVRQENKECSIFPRPCTAGMPITCLTTMRGPVSCAILPGIREIPGARVGFILPWG